MKKILGILVLGLLVAAMISMRAFAADEAGSQGMKMGMCDKMAGNMQGKMMGAKHEGMEQKMDLEEMFNHKARLIMENATELGLSEDQIEKVKMLKMNVKKSEIKSDADIEVLAIDIEDALEKDEVNVMGANALLDKKYGIKSQAAKDLVSAYADLKKILTKDQMKKLHEIWGKGKMDMDKMGKDKMEKGKEMKMDMKK